MNTVFDPLRKKEVALTPEEGVRQAVIAWLRDTVGIPQVRMQSEWPFKYNGLTFRADIIVFDRNLNPEILVECKAPEVAIDRKVAEQVIRYVRVLKVKHIIITNGAATLFFTLDGDPYRPTAGLQPQD